MMDGLGYVSGACRDVIAHHKVIVVISYLICHLDRCSPVAAVFHLCFFLPACLEKVVDTNTFRQASFLDHGTLADNRHRLPISVILVGYIAHVFHKRYEDNLVPKEDMAI